LVWTRPALSGDFRAQNGQIRIHTKVRLGFLITGGLAHNRII